MSIIVVGFISTNFQPQHSIPGPFQTKNANRLGLVGLARLPHEAALAGQAARLGPAGLGWIGGSQGGLGWSGRAE